MPEPMTRPPGPEIPRDFSFGGALTKAWKVKATADDGTVTELLYLSGVASSSVRDRQGDTITAQCQADMLEQLQAGIGRDGHRLTMFLNHDYDVPEDVLGNVNESRLTASAPADGEDAVIDLEIVCRVTSENPRAVMAWKIVNDGISLGFSVGGSLTEYEVDDENDDGESWCPPLLINGMALWEISLCGIPANPRAYTEQLKTASAQTRLAALAAAHRFMREIGVDDEAPEPSRNWARDARRGLVRRATRSKEVRDTLREVLAKSHAGVSGTAPTAKDVSNPDDPDYNPDDPEYDPTEDPSSDQYDPGLTAAAQAAVTVAIGSLKSAMDHGMCDDSMQHAKKGHDALVGLMTGTPAAEDPAAPGAAEDDTASSLAAAVAALAPEQREAFLELTKDAILLDAGRIETAELDDQIASKRADLERIAGEAVQRAAELEQAQAALELAKAEANTLTERIEELKRTPTGRQTVPMSPFTASTPASDRESPFLKTSDQARRDLAEALHGATAVDNPAQRPA
jgi:phage head maturation protease